MAKETIIVGSGQCTQLVFKSRDGLTIGTGFGYAAVALVFTQEVNEGRSIEFKFTMGSGLKVLDPCFVVQSQTQGSFLALSAIQKDKYEVLGGFQMEYKASPDTKTSSFRSFCDYYIGVEKQRTLPMKSLQYHSVYGPTQQHLLVYGKDIVPGDRFKFYVPDAATALSSFEALRESFHKMKVEDIEKVGRPKKEVIGALVFASGNQNELCMTSNAICAPILAGFPNIPIGGMLCMSEIGRAHIKSSCSKCSG